VDDVVRAWLYSCGVSVTAFSEVDATLVLVAEARERAERAARTVSESAGPAHVVDALARVDRELLALHRRLMDETLFHVEGAEPQLALDAA
jgi:hypothetical protein